MTYVIRNVQPGMVTIQEVIASTGLPPDGMQRLFRVMQQYGYAEGETLGCSPVSYQLTDHPAPDAAQLNADITAAEVERALRRAKRGKAAGHDGLSADLLKDAAPALLDKYVDLFNLMLAGDIPDALSMGIITAVHKTDDLVLISRSAMGLQGLLDTLHQFATCRRLQVSIKKTEVLVFQPRRPALASLPTLHYNRKALKKVHHFKYLGLSLETQGGFREAIAQLCASARRAAFAVRHRCCRQGISSLDCILKLFNAKVLPILSYGCEVWWHLLHGHNQAAVG
eukprot:jgi/Astpho2/5062/Aster-05984